MLHYVIRVFRLLAIIFLVVKAPFSSFAQQPSYGNGLVINRLQSGNAITIYPDSVLKEISPLLTGACIEDVNHEIYGGIYSQMVFGESFQELPMNIDEAVAPGYKGLSGSLSCKAPRDILRDESEIRSWQPLKKGSATGSYGIDSIRPFVGRQSQEIHFVSGAGVIGIENRGLNRAGMSVSGDKIYEGTIWAKADRGIQLHITLESEDGSTGYAATGIFIDSRQWKAYHFKLTPARSASHVRFDLALHERGGVDLGYVYMQPGGWGRYKDLPVRKDVVDGLINQHLTVLRYGGSMVNASDYRWKNMIGPRERRPPYKGTWYPFSSNGWGIIDFLNLCEAAGITAVPAFNSNETPDDMADFVEYVNGGNDSKWGKQRIADGHADPYHLKYIELGNEQFNDEKLTGRFRTIADAIWSKDKNIQVVFCISDNTREDISGDLPNFKKTIDHCREMGHQAWFDVHVYNDNEKEPDLKDFVFAEEQLSSVARDRNFRLCIFEENADNARIRRGLAHANAIGRVQRLAYDIPIVCAANCLQVDHQNDNGWDRGLLFLNNTDVWGQPSYYVTQMMAGNYLPKVVRTAFVSGSDTLDITSRTSADGRVVVLQVVNSRSTPVNAQVVLAHCPFAVGRVSATLLKGDGLEDWNTAEEPFRIVPVTHPVAAKENGCDYTFAPYSFTVLRFEE